MHVSTRAALLAATLVWATSASAQTYTLEEAVRTAVANSPQGEATAARLDGLNAARSAADTNPAPTIDGTVENIGTPGFSQWQIDGTYNQRLERGGKRAARVGLAQGDIAVAEAEALVRRLDLASEVQALYVEAQAAALSLELARSRVEIAETLANEVQRRVDEARDPLFAGTRARTQLAEARVDLGLAEHAFEAALARLALLTGGDPRSIGVVTSGFLEAEEIAITNADLTPVDLAVFQARRERADANYRLQEANSRTDPTVFAGPRLFGNGDVAVIAGFSLPLPSVSTACLACSGKGGRPPATTTRRGRRSSGPSPVRR